ncbi:UDP-glucose/GDP-mannose dehydrogenase family protein [Candidatus Woesebacteria bacterium]|nr:UDP-glucose/GDP-mannose dehydrogenase family protein [Candidatus Woesebacteria bacterium]
MQIAVVGTGFVGVVTAAVFAKLGHTVVGLDIDPAKVESLNQGKVPFFEPGLENLLAAALQAGNLTFTTEYQQAVPTANVVVIAVGTPSSPEGKADTTYVFSAVDALAPLLTAESVVVIKSTVPPGILTTIRERIAEKTTVSFHLASMPEFLREGSAVEDTLKPDRIVIGAEDEQTAAILTELHAPLGSQIVITSPSSAQLGKYAANSYLALRIGFINQIADLCEKTGADVQEVISIIGADERIGSHYWYPGLGYGGSCFPKDVRELSYASRELGLGETLFVKLNELNIARPDSIFAHWTEQVGGWQGKKVAVLGLSFKPNTNDMREAPSVWLIPKLLEAGATVCGYDPKALPEAKVVIGAEEGLTYTEQLDEAIKGVDCIVALVEWEQILQHDFAPAADFDKKRFFIDARNQFKPEQVKNWGYQYLGIGRVKEAK